MNKRTLLLLGILSIYQISFGQIKDISKLNWQKFSMDPEVNKTINPTNFNSNLLNMAVLHATNQIRNEYDLPLFVYDAKLEKAAQGHCIDMINDEFIDHFNRKNQAKKNPELRVKLETVQFNVLAENIAQVDLLDHSNLRYCFNLPSNGIYMFLDCDSKKEIKIHTYWSLAKKLVFQWMNSPGHKANILNSKLTHLGCGVAFSKNAFKSSTPPYCRSTQNFGSL